MLDSGYLLGYDIGSSSIKACLVDIQSGHVAASAASPQTELDIISPRPGWAEQDPEVWWTHVKRATALLRGEGRIDLSAVRAIGISYQMHGLVMVDKNRAPLSNAIIWCDGRAVNIGPNAFEAIAEAACRARLLNSPGNFTASKLAWVKENDKATYDLIFKIMLPGDYIAMKLTGEITTTPGGLSEGVLWDFENHGIADIVTRHFGFSRELFPSVVPGFSVQGTVADAVASELGIRRGTPVSYRAGDQPNNALSLSVLDPGEVAATAGTSAVIYRVSDVPVSDSLFRFNTFAHVNYTETNPRYGVLLCVNGSGILNRWVRQTMCTVGKAALTYDEMNAEACKAPPACDGLMVFPYGNGAERTLENRNVGAAFHEIDLTRHSRVHVLRAVQEGIVFALRYGLDVMRGAGIQADTVRVGHANMFKSGLFAEVFAAVCGTTVDLCNTDGAQGAARGAGIGAGIYRSAREAFESLAVVRTVRPNPKLTDVYTECYERWKELLESRLDRDGKNAA